MPSWKKTIPYILLLLSLILNTIISQFLIFYIEYFFMYPFLSIDSQNTFLALTNMAFPFTVFCTFMYLPYLFIPGLFLVPLYVNSWARKSQKARGKVYIFLWTQIYFAIYIFILNLLLLVPAIQEAAFENYIF